MPRSLVLPLLLVAACKRAPAGEASCDQAGQRVHALALAQVTTSPAVTDRAEVTGLLAPMRDSFVRHCREQSWSAAVRACFVAAPDLTALAACNAQLPAAARAKLVEHAAGKRD